MYPRVLQNLLTASTKLKNQRTLKIASVILSNVALSTEKRVPSIIPHYHARYFSSDSDIDKEILKLPKDPLQRKAKIDEMAQKEIEQLLKDNPEMEKLMKVLELEMAVRREDGERIPDSLRPRELLELLKLPGRNQRRAYLNFLFVNEKRKEQKVALQLEKNELLEQIRERRAEETTGDEIVYAVACNSLLRRVMEPTMNKLWNWNALRASMFGNKIVFDFSLESYMNSREIKSCAKQIMESYAVNRQHNFPFDVYLCNVDFKGQLFTQLQRYIPTILEDDFPITISTKSYLDLFDKSKLVYLTSDARKEVETYDPDMVYIIGALVDKGPKHPVTLGIAKKQGLEMLKLPLDSKMKFGDGSGKELTLNQVFAIMLDAQGNDWEKALSHVPRRKLYESRIRALERKVHNQLYSKQCEEADTMSSKLDFERRVFNTETSISQSIMREKLKYGQQKRNSQEITSDFNSPSVNDFSHAARAKLKKQWND